MGACIDCLSRAKTDIRPAFDTSEHTKTSATSVLLDFREERTTPHNPLSYPSFSTARSTAMVVRIWSVTTK